MNGAQENYIDGIVLESADVPKPLTFKDGDKIETNILGTDIYWKKIENAWPHSDWGYVASNYGMFVERHDTDGDTVIWYELPHLDPDKIHRVIVWDTEDFASVHMLEWLDVS